MMIKGNMSFQRKKKPKEKPVVSVQSEEVVAKESVALGQEPPCPAGRKRRRQPLKVGMETVTAVRSQKVRNVSAPKASKASFPGISGPLSASVWFNKSVFGPSKKVSAMIKHHRDVVMFSVVIFR